MLIEKENITTVETPTIILDFPFNVIKFAGNESVDFLQRITTNDFSHFTIGSVQKTLLVTDKGRILDTVWVIHRNDHLLMLTSDGMSEEIISWLNKYIIMEDITVTNVSNEFIVNAYFSQNNNFYHSEYFGIPVSFEIIQQFRTSIEKTISNFEIWRIEHGIPVTKKEMVQDYNPLELNLWDWISFTKGCYIGQEVIARLDTYNKIQRILCKVSSTQNLNEQEMLVDESGAEVGKITSMQKSSDKYIGLAVIRNKFAIENQQLESKENNVVVTIQKVFQKDGYGRN